MAIVSPYRADPSATPSGSSESALDWYTNELATAIAIAGCDVEIIGPRNAGAEPWSDGGVRVTPSYLKGHPLACVQMLAAVRRSPRTIVHVQHELFAFGGSVSAFCLPLAMRGFGRPVVTTLHGVIPLDSIDRDFVASNAMSLSPLVVRTLWRHLIREISSRSAVVHVHENEHRDRLRTQYGVRERIEVEPIGTRPRASVETAAARRRWGFSASARVVLFFGYLLERKGIVVLLESVDRLLSSDPEIVLVVAGNVPQRVAGTIDVMASLEKLQSRERFHYLGYVADDDVPAVFAAADAIIFPYTRSISASGSFALAIGERRPVLLSEVFAGSYPSSPFLFEPTVNGIVEAISSFFSSETSRIRADEFVTGLAEQRTWAATAARMTAIYGSLTLSSKALG